MNWIWGVIREEWKSHSHIRLFYDPMDCGLPGSSVQGILQARVLEWVAISFSRGSSWPRDQTQVSCTAGRFFTNWATRKAPKRKVGTRFPVWANRWWWCYLLTRKNKGSTDLEGKKNQEFFWTCLCVSKQWVFRLEKRCRLKIKFPKLLPYNQRVKLWIKDRTWEVRGGRQVSAAEKQIIMKTKMCPSHYITREATRRLLTNNLPGILYIKE